MKQRSEHLSSAQIEEYGSQSSGAGPETEAWIESHLADCPSCRRRVLDFQRAHFALLAAPKVNTFPTLDCPSEDDLRDLAAGLCPEALADKLSVHAATCNHCGPLLRDYKEDFSDDFTPEEQAILNNLQSASAEWQKKTARQMLEVRVLETAGVNAADASAAKDESSRAATTVKSDVKSAGSKVSTTPARKIFSWKWVLVPATAAIVALAAFSIWYTQRDTPEKVEKLLAQAYTEQRTMEMRWPGAEWGVYSVQRGNNIKPRPLPLVQAEDVLENRSQAELKDFRWIRAAAEKDIAIGKPGDAIVILERAAQSDSASVQSLLDLAIAYFAQGEQSHTQVSYEKSRQILDRILQHQPKNTVAMFNRALVNQRLSAFDEAEKDWQTFLKTETDAAWLNEAKQQLQYIQEMNRSNGK